MKFMRKLLKSRKNAIMGLLIVTVFFIGAILGSLKAAILVYLGIAVAAVAAALLIVYGCTGTVAYKEDSKRDISSK